MAVVGRILYSLVLVLGDAIPSARVFVPGLLVDVPERQHEQSLQHLHLH
jgi:hypothetical protein